jgi:hypothetical protein
MLEIPFRGKKKKANSRKSIPEHVSDKNKLSILFAGAGFFVKLIFFMPFSSIPSQGIDSSVNLGMPRNEHFLRGITEASPSLFRGIFSERHSVANPNLDYRSLCYIWMYLDYRSLCYIWTYLELQEPVLHLDLSRLQELVLHLDVCRPQETVQHLAISLLQELVLHLDVSRL